MLTMVRCGTVLLLIPLILGMFPSSFGSTDVVGAQVGLPEMTKAIGWADTATLHGQGVFWSSLPTLTRTGVCARALGQDRGRTIEKNECRRSPSGWGLGIE